MPIRVKSRSVPGSDRPLRTPSPVGARIDGVPLPDIFQDDSFRVVVKKLSIYLASVITLPSSFEQLRTTSAGDSLHVLVDHLSYDCTNPAIVNALLALKWHYGAASEEKSLNEARANACEIVAWRFLTHLSEREVVDYCLYEIPEREESEHEAHPGGAADEEHALQEPDEHSALLAQAWSGTASSGRRTVGRSGPGKRSQLLSSLSRLTMNRHQDSDESDTEDDDPTTPFIGLNALEIAAIADAKRFISQHVVQKIITGIWTGDIIFWDKLSVDSVKRPRFYNDQHADPFSRLRVPKYLKSFEVVFFIVFLCLYYSVLVERNPYKISVIEVFLYIWFAAFFYDELSEWMDAGSIFYAADVWNVFDMIMISIGIIFVGLRIFGLSNGDDNMIELAFDVLSLEALFMVPRVCSILSLSPYWGTLIPCLKQMLQDFIKFMVLVVIIYLGFLTTFTLVGRKTFTLSHMSMILTKIFFGSSYVGFDIMGEIDPIFGPPLMIIFVTLSSILLVGSLTGMLSNSFSRVISHAREEYLYVYSVYVLEASTSNRLTHFYPPFNLLALVIFRPLRLFLPSDNKFRAARIVLLKATHLPIVGVILLYETIAGRINRDDEFAGFKGPRQQQQQQPPGHQQGGGGAGTPKRLRRHQRPPSYYLRSPNPQGMSGSTELSHPWSAAAMAALQGDYVEGSSDTDTRIAELTAKIDRLTDLVLSLQAQQPANVGLP